MRTGMDISLRRMIWRVALVAAALGCAGTIGAVAGRRWVAAHWAGSKHPADWERALRLEPGNAGYWHKMGLYEEWDFQHGDIQRAIKDFHRATEIDPRNDGYWMDLASAYEAAGRVGEAREAYRKALAAHPASAAVAWRYGSFLLRRGEDKEAAAQIRRSLVGEPELAASAVSQFWRAGVGIERILNEVLPAQAKEYLDAIGYFVSAREDGAALATWEKLVGLGEPVPLEKSFPLIRNLIRDQRVDDAARVWRQALKASGREGEAGTAGSLVYNGGFEHDLADGGFGWREKAAPGTGIYLVGDVKHGGSQSARVTFDGSQNVNFHHLQQYVAVVPGRKYRFSAYMRTDSISTDSGVKFQIDDLSQAAAEEAGTEAGTTAVAETTAMTGTHRWTQVEAEFTAGPEMHGVAIVLRREPSRMFDNKIRGTVWVDDVRLSEAGSEGAGSR